MKGVKACVYSGFSRKIIPFFICFAIMLCPFSAYALNTDLVSDEVYWIDKGKEINYVGDDYFAGFSKYIVDEDDGCFYLFTRFTDYRIDTNSKENITFAFTIKNESNSYYFQVDAQGIVNSASQNTLNAVDVYYNFDEASCRRQGGGVYIAFRLKNAADRELKNYISCEYSCGLNVTYNIFENICLDMYVPTTVKSTAQKTTKQAAARSTTAGKTTASKSSAQAAKESSTKFSGSGTAYSSRSASEGTTKFSAAGTNQSGSTEETAETEEISGNAVAENGSSAMEISGESVDYSRSQQANLLIIVFAVLFVIGVVCVIIGIVNNKKDKEVTDKNDSSSD